MIEFFLKITHSKYQSTQLPLPLTWHDPVVPRRSQSNMFLLSLSQYASLSWLKCIGARVLV